VPSKPSSNIRLSHARPRHPRELAHNELKIALNRGEIKAQPIGQPERQTVLGIVASPGITRGSRLLSRPRLMPTV
jgi:hypothetical protein